MKKKLIVLMIITIIVLYSTLIYLIYDDLKYNNEIINDNYSFITFDDIKVIDFNYKNYILKDYELNTIIEKEFILNNKEHKIDYIYFHKKDYIYNDYGSEAYDCMDCYVYNVYFSIVYDNKLIGLNNIYYDTYKNNGDMIVLKPDSNIYIISDIITNEEYLVLNYKIKNVNDGIEYVTIIGKNGEILYQYSMNNYVEDRGEISFNKKEINILSDKNIKIFIKNGIIIEENN